MNRFWNTIFGILATLGAAAPAVAQDVTAKWPWKLEDSGSLIHDRLTYFHNGWLMPLITIVVIFVFVLLVYIMLRFNHKSNPVPQKFTHNIPLEIVWTVIPALILTVLAFPSLKLLYYVDKMPGKPEMTIKATGHQWYWEYQYQDAGNFSFNSNIVPDKDLQPGQPRMLTADNALVIPVNTNVQVLVTGADVIHAFFVPAFGVNTNAIPGRMNQVWINATHEGTFYGQCNKICGMNHGYMPIMVQVVSKQKYQQWLLDAKKKFADDRDTHAGNLKFATKE